MTTRVPSPDEALRIFRERFLNRTDVVSILAPWGKPCPIDANGTLDDLLLGHLFGNRVPATKVTYRTRRGTGVMKGWYRVGSYTPGLDDTTRWLCLDFDGGADHTYPLEDPLRAALATVAAFEVAGLPPYLESSGSSTGWHVWCFFDPPLPAPQARAVGHALAPRDQRLVERLGGFADPRRGRGIEVFPKQDKLRRKRRPGVGTPVWLPWWQGAHEGGSTFFQRGPGGGVEPYVPGDFTTAAPEAIERVLAALPTPRRPRSLPRPQGSTSPGPGSARRHDAPAERAGQVSSADKAAWAQWRGRALTALPLEAIYGSWLTGRVSGVGWLECRDPASPSGDQQPSAGVADGTGEAERGSFHSFISGATVSVFDFLIAHGGAADFLDAARRVATLSGISVPAPAPEATARDAAPPAGRPPSSGSATHTARRPEICVNDRQLRDLIDDAWSAVRVANRCPSLFVRAGVLVRLVPGEPGARIEPMNEPEAYGYLARIADWVRTTEIEAFSVSPPKDVARDMLAYPHAELPKLEAVVSTPVFDREGALVATQGYHSQARLWYEPPANLNVPAVPAQPSPEDVAAARNLLLDEMLGEFPFVDSASRAHMVAALLLPFARRLIPGATPIHLFEAPSEGSGKGLLVNLVAILATGAPVAGGSIPTNEDEIRKKIGSELSTGRPLLALDNADHKRPLDSSAIASATTMWPLWTDRLLGHIKMFTVPNQAVWIVTANNPRLSREIARRCVSIRINPGRDRPWLRKQFRHPSLSEWAIGERARLIHAALVLIQNWIAHGQPPGATTLGSFERWASVMGGILQAAGVDGFLGNLEQLYASADAEGTMWREFVAAWWSAYQGRPRLITELVRLCVSGEFLAPVLGDGSERSQSTRLGKALQNMRDRVFGDYRIEFAGRDSDSKRALYQLTPCPQQDEVTQEDTNTQNCAR